jgi:hypothetical protein
MTMILRTIILSILIYFAAFPAVLAQIEFTFHEDSLKKLARKIVEPEHDFEKLAMNLEFKKYFEQVLLMDGSINYPFDSLITISRLTAEDKSFRVISWYVPLSDNHFEYFGFFQSRIPSNRYMLYSLTDNAMNQKDPLFETLDNENWYGAYYTNLIHKKHRRKDYYLLLGWRGDNPLTRKRIIEPIKIMGQGRPSFGEPVFRFENNRHRRIIYEYSAKVSMSLRYEAHSVEGFSRPQEIIIFDRMAPTHSFLKGHYQFYVPETNVFDGFMFEDGKWIFISDIDAKNPRRRPVARPVPPPQ